MSEDKFDCKTVSFETENTGNGTVLKCINAGENVELVSTWFAREEDANLWKSFLEYMANNAIHSVNFTEDQRAALIAERDALKNECNTLSGKLDIVKDSIQSMFDSISTDPVQGSVVSFNSLNEIEKGRYYKVCGCNSMEASRKVKNLHESLLELENPSFMQLCTDQDKLFMNMFGQPLFSSSNYMSSTVRKHVKGIFNWLCLHKVESIRENLKTQGLKEVSESLKVHPAYVWAVCVKYEIPFVNDCLLEINDDHSLFSEGPE